MKLTFVPFRVFLTCSPSASSTGGEDATLRLTFVPFRIFLTCSHSASSAGGEDAALRLFLVRKFIMSDQEDDRRGGNKPYIRERMKLTGFFTCFFLVFLSLATCSCTGGATATGGALPTEPSVLAFVKARVPGLLD